jgi:hypothetical protein
MPHGIAPACISPSILQALQRKRPGRREIADAMLVVDRERLVCLSHEK